MLENHLQCNWHIAPLLDGLEYLAEFTTSDRLDAMEIIDCPGILLFFLFFCFPHRGLSGRRLG